jgi:hypothetical protein
LSKLGDHAFHLPGRFRIKPVEGFIEDEKRRGAEQGRGNGGLGARAERIAGDRPWQPKPRSALPSSLRGLQCFACKSGCAMSRRMDWMSFSTTADGGGRGALKAGMIAAAHRHKTARMRMTKTVSQMN